MATYKVYATEFALLDYNQPYTNNHTAQVTNDSWWYMLLKFGSMPDIGAYVGFVKATLVIRSPSSWVSRTTSAGTLTSTFDPSIVGWNTRPTWDSSSYNTQYGFASGDGLIRINLELDTGVANLQKALANGLYINPGDHMYTPASAYKPYIEIETGPTATIIPGTLTAYYETFDQDISNRFTIWPTQSAPTLQPVQFSATLEIKDEENSSQFFEMEPPSQFSGSRAANIPTMTLQVGRFSARAVVVSGNSTQYSSWIDITVRTATVRINPATFVTADTLTHAVSFPHVSGKKPTSAKLLWRRKGSTIEHSIDLDGLDVTVPAKTFYLTGNYERAIESTWSTGLTSRTDWEDLSLSPIIISSPTPFGGFVDETHEVTFRWLLFYSASSLRIPASQTAAQLRWKASQSDTEHTISVTSDNEITLPANTLPGDGFLWSVTATAADDTVVSTEWIPVATVETATSTAIPVSPISTVLDGSLENLFAWSHIIATGTLQTRADIQVKTTHGEWSDLKSVTGETTSATFLPGELPPGLLQWRVRTYNTEGTPGEWSEPVSVTVIAAPSTPILRVFSAAPHFRVGWETNQQQNFEVSIDGTTVAAEFGEAREYQYPDYLSPGLHMIAVRSQNEYGLWSTWGQLSITISNTPGAAISLSAGNSQFAATLSWQTSGTFERFQVLRDGAVIGYTTENVFSDQFAPLSASRYQVRGLLADGNFSESNQVDAVTTVPTISVFGLESREWLPLALSAQQMRTSVITMRRQTALTHFAGTALPTLELGEQYDATYQFACAFRPDDPLVSKFDTILGQPVILKDPHGVVMAGVINALDKRMVETHIAYTCTVSAVDLQEVDVNG